MKRFMGLCLAMIMMLTILPQMTVLAVTQAELDASIALADKGAMYVSGNSLPTSATVGGTNYAVTYESDDPSVIGTDGTVTHGALFKHVTVTPNFTSGGQTVKGSEQRLLVLPTGGEEVFFEDFEDFNAGAITNHAVTNGWQCDYDEETQKAEILNDNTQYYHAQVVTAGHASQNVRLYTYHDDLPTSGLTMIALRAKIGSSSSSTTDGFFVEHTAFFDNANLTGGNGLTSVSLPGYTNTWHDFVFIIDNGDTVSEQGALARNMSVYMDGIYQGSMYSYPGPANFLLIQLARFYAHEGSADDVLIYNLGEITMNDQEKASYIAEKIQKSALTSEVNGAITQNLTLSTNYKDFYADTENEYADTTITWKTDNSAISTNGVVTRGDLPQAVKVTATVSVDDETVEKSFYFTVAPAGSESFAGGKFDLDFNQLKTSEEAAAGWTFDNSSVMAVSMAKSPREESTALKITNASASQLGLRYKHEDSINCGEFGKRYAFGCDLAFVPDTSATNGNRVFFEINGAALEARVGLDFTTQGVYLLFGQSDRIFSKRHLDLESGEWFHFNIDFNTAKKSWVAYINGMAICENPISMDAPLWNARRPFRSLGFRMSGNSTLYVDNMYGREYAAAEAFDDNADFTVTNFKLTNGSGAMIKNLTADTTQVNATIRLVENRPAADGVATLLLAHYDKAGMLVEVVKKDIEASKVEGTVGYPDVTMSLNLIGDCTGHMVKAFVMRLGTVQPVTGMISLEDEIVFDTERLLSETPEYCPAEELGYTEADNSSKYPQIQEIMFDGEPYKGNPTKHFAYLGLPEGASAANPVPAVVIVHGGGGTAYPQFVNEWNRRGYAAIAMDLNGCVPDVDSPDARRRHAWAGPWQDNYTDLYSQENVWMYHAVTAVVKANSILRSLPEVDSSKIGVTGVSWGSVVTCTTLGVDDRFAFAVPVYGCGFLYESQTYMSDLMTREKMAWDASNFIKKSNLPILFINGDRDPAFDINIYTKTASLVGDRGTMCIIPNFRHDHPDAWAREEVYAFADSVVAGGEQLVRPGEVTVSGDKATVALDIPSSKSITTVKLYYTTGDITYHEDGSTVLFAFHESTSYTNSGNTYTFDVPQGTTYFYIDFTDSDGLMTSTKLITLQKN